MAWFVLLSLLPLSYVSWKSYDHAKRSLLEEASKILNSNLALKERFIQNWFHYRFTDLNHQAQLDSNLQFLQALRGALDKSERSSQDFVKSYPWVLEVEKYGRELVSIRRDYHLHDVFLIDDKAQILFTVARETDLGTSLITGEHAHTNFARTCREVLNTGKSMFSDFEVYAPSGDDLYSFFLAPVVDGEGAVAGVFAYQVTMKRITDLMEDRAGLGDTGVSYLVKSDALSLDKRMYLRSAMTQGDLAKQYLEQPITSELLERWFAGEYPEGYEKSAAYDNPRGVPVLGNYRSVLIGDEEWCVVVEIHRSEAYAPVHALARDIVIAVVIMIVLVLILAYGVARRLLLPLLRLREVADRIAKGDLETNVHIDSQNEVGELAQSFGDLLESLRYTEGQYASQMWIAKGQVMASETMRGMRNTSEMSSKVLEYITPYIGASIAALYLKDRHEHYHHMGGYAFVGDVEKSFALGESLLGQCAQNQEMIELHTVPDDYLMVQSALGQTKPHHLLMVPLLVGEECVGVAEFGFLEKPHDDVKELLKSVSENMAVSFQVLQSRQTVDELLEGSQIQARELERQKEALKDTNEKLSAQAETLQRSEQALQEQSGALQLSNEELEARRSDLETERLKLKTSNLELEKQRDLLQHQKLELEESERAIREQSKKLSMANQYKSEFLANMSHELRTPLNSMLLLSKHLSDNRDGNLSERQVEDLRVIHDGGSDLLNLINDIMDLSKVEAGKMDVVIEEVSLLTLMENMRRMFEPQALSKGLLFEVSCDEGCPTSFETDGQRLEQVLKNLLSNAIKFTTKQGRVSLKARLDVSGQSTAQALLRASESLQPFGKRKSEEVTAGKLVFVVEDTGIGISKDKQDLIFEAFQQEDGSTSRQYGGTGLGLSICREMGRLLGGHLKLESEVGKGSAFSFELNCPISEPSGEDRDVPSNMVHGPILEDPNSDRTAPMTQKGTETGLGMKDDGEKDRPFLIIEDDPNFAEVIKSMIEDRGYRALVCLSAREGMLKAEEHNPLGIILDLGLPDLHGEKALKQLKANRLTRHIPVHIVSGQSQAHGVLLEGALGLLNKPISSEGLEKMMANMIKLNHDEERQILVVEDDVDTASILKENLRGDYIHVRVASSGAEALEALKTSPWDLMILDLGLPDAHGFEIIDAVAELDPDRVFPIIVYTGNLLSLDERLALKQKGQRLIIKEAESEDFIWDEVGLFLNMAVSHLPPKILAHEELEHHEDRAFKGKKVLLVDDDMRNIYALSQQLRDHGLEVELADNGETALQKLSDDGFEIDLVLMDMMMPVMDGYEATRRIREGDGFADLPIIALTANAMADDRQACFDAGVSDYLTKPVALDKLLAMLRVWMFGRRT